MRRFAKVFVLGVAVFTFQVVAPVTVMGQVRGLGRLNGQVLDQSGAPVEGVTIQTKTALGDAIDAKTDAKGGWVVPGLGKGLWEVDFVKDGFIKVKAKITVEKELMRTEPIKITLKKA